MDQEQTASIVLMFEQRDESDNPNNLELMEYFSNTSFFDPTLFGKAKALTGYNKKR